MAKKSIKKKNNNYSSAYNACKILLAGCLAEFYLLLLNKYYVNGDLNALFWEYQVLPIVNVVSVALVVLGVAAVVLMRKKGGWKLECGIWGIVTGAFLLIATWCVRQFFESGAGVRMMSVMVPVLAALGILWFLFDRECFYALAVLSVGLVSSWICRHGANNAFWRTYVYVGAIVLLILLALCVLVFRKADQTDGKLRNIRILPKHADPLPTYVACGLSAAAVVLSLISATIGYYATWVLGIVMFVLLIYYMVKHL